MAVMTSRVSTAVRVLGLTVALAAGVATPAAAQEGPLGVARDLYASARYDEALAMLNGVRQQESANPVNLRYIEQHAARSASWRLGGAPRRKRPSLSSSPPIRCICRQRQRASPRVRSAFSEVRQRQLPDIARTRASAKSAFDRKDYPAAEQQFRICCGSSTIPT